MVQKAPLLLNLLHKGKEHRLLMGRHENGLWSVLLEDRPWAVGKRLGQAKWVVAREGATQHGRTLEQAVASLFYNMVGS